MIKTAIYGIGEFGKIFLKALNYDIDFLIDDYSNESSFEDIPLKKVSEIKKDTKIYISILQHSKKIENQLKKDGFVNIINFKESIKSLPYILELISENDYLWLSKDHVRMLNEEKIYKFKKLLKDKKSKKILDDIIKLRKTLDPKYYIEPEDIEYFPSDIKILNGFGRINFIDCGAYTGDTIAELLKQTKNIGYTLSFEPDKNNLIKLEQTLNNLNSVYSQINFLSYPAGVYSSNKILSFSNNGINSSAGIDYNSSLQVPVVSLDSIILNSNPTYIKMDIEGAEKEALLGAIKTIQKHKPNLAICLYHKPEDLWELPLLINEIEPLYDMYIRVHEDLCLSTVLYCISKEKKDV